MRLEVLVGENDPVVYPLSGEKVSIGSAETCDIVLSTDGISRKHLSIVIEGDSFFVVDLGSANGTFMNEERLIPGKRVEFTSFFPVRLGKDVLLSLLSDEEAQAEGMIEIPLSFKEKKVEEVKPVNQEATRVVSLSEIGLAKTEKLVNIRNTKRIENKAKATNASKKKKKTNLVGPISFVLLLSAGAYNIFKVQKEKESAEVVYKSIKETENKIVTEAKTTTNSNETEPKQESLLIPEEDLVKKSSFDTAIQDIKCTTEEEKFYCLYFPGTSEQPFGVIKVGLSFYVMVDGSAFIGHARAILKKPVENNPEIEAEYEKLVYRTAAYIYLLRASNGPLLDLEKLVDSKFSIAIYEKIDGQNKLATVIAITPKAFNSIKTVVFDSNLELISTNGASALELTKKHYITY